MFSRVTTIRKLRFWWFCQSGTHQDFQISRKIWHMGGSFCLAYAYGWLVPSKEQALWLLSVFGGLIILLDILRLKHSRMNRLFVSLGKPMFRKHETATLSTMTPLILAVFLVVTLFPRPVAVLSFLYLALGDPAAAFFGIKYGKDKILWNKSLQGSLGAFVVCMIATWGFLSYSSIPVTSVFLFSIIGGFAGMIAEVAPTGLDDNFSLPVVSSLILHPVFLLLSQP